MRGGFIGCFGGDPRMLDQVVAHLRWHRGKAVCHRGNGFEIASLVDPAEGPAMETRAGRVLFAHGAAPAPLPELQRREGRFAAVEWDGSVLRATRDPLGLAPLFVRPFRDGVWLSTEIAPLLALGLPGPDVEALSARAAFAPLHDRTGWQGISRVLPGTTLESVTGGSLSSTVYAKPGEIIGRYRGGRSEALAEFRERFRSAVARCWEPRSAILLSGGYDSAAIALTASSLGRGLPYLVHVHFAGIPSTQEQGYAGAVASAVGAPLHVVAGEVDRWDIEAELEVHGMPYSWLPYGMDDPPLAHIASQGITAALDGHDGDGVLGPAGSEWGTLIAGGELNHLGRLISRYGVRRALRGAAADLVPPRVRRLVGGNRRRTYLESVARYFGEPLKRRILEMDIDRWRWPWRRWSARQLLPVLPQAAISYEQKEIEAARHGIDLRHPFADRELVEFLVSLPCAIKSDPGRAKPLLVDALDCLSDVIHDRPKSDYMAVVRRRVDPARCIEGIRASGVRLPGIDYQRLFDDGKSNPEGIPLFLLVNLARVHGFAQRAARGDQALRCRA